MTGSRGATERLASPLEPVVQGVQAVMAAVRDMEARARRINRK
jgi:hypothetical protein